jgi:hypothetical protein
MRQSRRRPHPPKDLGIAADVATDTDTDAARARRGNRYDRMRLPHERDESTHAPDKPNPVTTQGERDLAEGRTDTDCYDAVGARYERKESGPGQ